MSGHLLGTLISALPNLRVIGGVVADDVSVVDITLDSRRVGAATIFVALPGTKAHGARFASQAVAAGAVAILTDDDGVQLIGECEIPVLVAGNVRQAMADLACLIFEFPSEKMLSFGVTGTNGKTTTIFLLENALASAGYQVGTVGTLGMRLGGRTLPSVTSTITTPESPDLQRSLAQLVTDGADSLAMEVSSHALVLERIRGIRFDVAGFTNLGRDHLDFHQTQEAYFEAKARLFTLDYAARAVIFVSDEASEQMADRARRAGLEVRTVGWTSNCDYHLTGWEPDPTGGAQLSLRWARREANLHIELPGEYNVANAALAIGMLDLAGVEIEAALDGLSAAQAPGRMQRVSLGEEAPIVYVDFAHTPQAIQSALAALTGRIIVVFGAGGDRDSAKRALMGEVAARGADVVIVTDDNPRSEVPAEIRQQVLAGARPGWRATEILDGTDRRSAINLALRKAEPGDTIAILGKGHEATQEISGELIEFDDLAVVDAEWNLISGGLDADSFGR